MKYRIPISVFTMVTVSIACGPFLAETILDRPRSVLDSRYGAFGFEMAVIDQQRNGNPTNLLASSRPEPVAFESFDAGKQLDTEVTELRDWWGAQGLKPEQVDALIERYRTWRELSRSVDLFGPYGVRSEPKETKPFPDSSALPGDVQLYLRGAQSYRAGDTTAARRIWTELLDLPAEQRRLRSTWAAWMLAKTSASAADALPWYQRVTDLRENEQCTDALNLSAAALGWRAAFTEDPVEKLKLYFDGAAAGCTRLLVDVHKIARDIGQGTDATLSARAAADPLVQQIVTATLLNGGRDDPASGTLPWVEFLENSGANEIANASRLAWLRYQQADFDQARKWVSLARKDDPSALWLRAKLALRDGDPDLAASQFARAISYYRPINEEHFSEFDGYGIPWSDTDTVTELMRRQFIADYGMTLVARAEFINAVDWLDRGGYHQDAEYLAEQVLTTDELLSWVERRFPQWHEPTPEDEQENAYGWNGIFHGDTDSRKHAHSFSSRHYRTSTATSYSTAQDAAVNIRATAWPRSSGRRPIYTTARGWNCSDMKPVQMHIVTEEHSHSWTLARFAASMQARRFLSPKMNRGEWKEPVKRRKPMPPCRFPFTGSSCNDLRDDRQYPRRASTIASERRRLRGKQPSNSRTITPHWHTSTTLPDPG
jgi:tetratricopeptide (TPR) repeat protein